MQWPTLVILATREAEIGRIMVQAQPRDKVCKTTSQSISWEWCCTPICHPSYAESINWRIVVQASLGIKGETLYQK
jgi:hypothetical protein